jgi:alanine racemase
MNIQHHYTTWTKIDLGAIESNVRYFVENSPAQVMAVVKANGYGHGAAQAASASLRGGATWCAVARTEEASELRQAGITCPILLLGFTPQGKMPEMILADVSMTVWDEAQIQAASEAAKGVGKPAHLHLKVDTGMSRLGSTPERTGHLTGLIKASPMLVSEGLFTHFACADEVDPAPTDQQVDRLLPMLEKLERDGLRPPLVHAANSATTLTRKNLHFDIVRAGIAIYGLHPSPDCPNPSSFRPAMTWKTQLSQVKMLPPGRGLSYGHIYTTSADERIGTLPVGYADGFRRTDGNQVLVGGKRVPVVGRVCMDQCLVQLDEVPEAAPGDEVVLIGQQGEEAITAEDVAECWGTINYEVTCGVGRRVPRLYLT